MRAGRKSFGVLLKPWSSLMQGQILALKSPDFTGIRWFEFRDEYLGMPGHGKYANGSGEVGRGVKRTFFETPSTADRDARRDAFSGVNADRWLC
jgi:hypothetical protein